MLLWLSLALFFSQSENASISTGGKNGTHSHRQEMGKGIALLNHDLVSDTSPGGVKVDPIRMGESFDLGIFLQVLGRLVLDVVVEREDWLTRVVNFAGTDRLEPFIGRSANFQVDSEST
jgi:hypothetical protein